MNMAEICYISGFYMEMITYDMIKFKETGQWFTMVLIYNKTLWDRIRSDQV